MASVRNWIRIWPRLAPRAQSSPISRRRRSPEMTMMSATQIAPTALIGHRPRGTDSSVAAHA
jgi:hypothetical protein